MPPRKEFVVWMSQGILKGWPYAYSRVWGKPFLTQSEGFVSCQCPLVWISSRYETLDRTLLQLDPYSCRQTEHSFLPLVPSTVTEPVTNREMSIAVESCDANLVFGRIS